MQVETLLTDRVREIMAEVFGVDEHNIPADLNQQDFAPWSSLEQVTLLIALESEFHLSFSTAEISSMTSLPAIIAALKKRGV